MTEKTKILISKYHFREFSQSSVLPSHQTEFLCVKNFEIAENCGFADIALSWKSLGCIAKQIRTMQSGLTDDECVQHKQSKEKKSTFQPCQTKVKAQKLEKTKRKEVQQPTYLLQNELVEMKISLFRDDSEDEDNDIDGTSQPINLVVNSDGASSPPQTQATST